MARGRGRVRVRHRIIRLRLWLGLGFICKMRIYQYVVAPVACLTSLGREALIGSHTVVLSLIVGNFLAI